VGKAKRAHQPPASVGTLRFAHPTGRTVEGEPLHE